MDEGQVARALIRHSSGLAPFHLYDFYRASKLANLHGECEYTIIEMLDNGECEEGRVKGTYVGLVAPTKEDSDLLMRFSHKLYLAMDQLREDISLKSAMFKHME